VTCLTSLSWPAATSHPDGSQIRHEPQRGPHHRTDGQGDGYKREHLRYQMATGLQPLARSPTRTRKQLQEGTPALPNGNRSSTPCALTCPRTAAGGQHQTGTSTQRRPCCCSGGVICRSKICSRRPAEADIFNVPQLAHKYQPPGRASPARQRLVRHTSALQPKRFKLTSAVSSTIKPSWQSASAVRV
jgi:hypothetical protein